MVDEVRAPICRRPQLPALRKFRAGTLRSQEPTRSNPKPPFKATLLLLWGFPMSSLCIVVHIVMDALFRRPFRLPPRRECRAFSPKRHTWINPGCCTCWTMRKVCTSVVSGFLFPAFRKSWSGGRGLLLPDLGQGFGDEIRPLFDRESIFVSSEISDDLSRKLSLKSLKETCFCIIYLQSSCE
jgi:hypothetical protein